MLTRPCTTVRGRSIPLLRNVSKPEAVGFGRGFELFGLKRGQDELINRAARPGYARQSFRYLLRLPRDRFLGIRKSFWRACDYLSSAFSLTGSNVVEKRLHVAGKTVRVSLTNRANLRQNGVKFHDY